MEERGGGGRRRWRRWRRRTEGSCVRKWKRGREGSDEGMLVEIRGVFDLKFRPGGNRGGVTHSNAPPPPTPPAPNAHKHTLLC